MCLCMESRLWGLKTVADRLQYPLIASCIQTNQHSFLKKKGFLLLLVSDKLKWPEILARCWAFFNEYLHSLMILLLINKRILRSVEAIIYRHFLIHQVIFWLSLIFIQRLFKEYIINIYQINLDCTFTN